MYERIQKICSYLKKENENSDMYISKEIKEKFKIYKNWLIENGAIFKENIDFPFTYGPFHKVGCKTISNINENEVLIQIPKSLIINSEDLIYIEKYIKNIIDELSEEEIPTIYLILYLYLEKQNQNSFYKPFIDILFLNEKNNNFINNKWNEKTLSELNDEISINTFEKMINNIEEIFDLIKQCDKFLNMTKNDFLNCYFQVISNKIDLNDKNDNSILVPLVHLFIEDNSIKLKYEIYDSENMIFKYTSNLNDENDSKINLWMTKSKFLPNNKPSYNKLLPFLVEYDKEKDNEEDEDDENKEIVKINNNDYFSIAVTKNEKIEKNNFICCNQSYLSNKKIFKNKGFCLLYNKNDYLNIKFKFNRGELLTDKYLENIFSDKYQTKNDDPIYNTLKIKIEFNDISSNLLKYFRFMYFYETKKNAKEYFKYHFDLKLEMHFINSAIDFLKNKLKTMEINYSFDIDMKNLENEIYNQKEPNYFKTNLLIFRISQKIILKNQIELLSYILKIMTKYNNKIRGYNNIFDYIDKEKILIEYDKEEYSRMKILRFIAYMIKTVDLI